MRKRGVQCIVVPNILEEYSFASKAVCYCYVKSVLPAYCCSSSSKGITTTTTNATTTTNNNDDNNTSYHYDN